MCGRYTLAAEISTLQEAFPGFVFPAQLPLRYNVTPGQEILLIPNTGENRAEVFRWGLVPSWAKDPKIGNRMINARAETLAEKPSFRTAYRKRRCLILADGFYEWRQDPGVKGKTPMYIRLKSGKPFVFAGLWESWRSPDGATLRTCTIITTAPNALMEDIHNRMPVILPPEAYKVWLLPEDADPRDLDGLLKPYPDTEMVAYPVSRLVNNPRADTPDCIEPAEPADTSEPPTLF